MCGFQGQLVEHCTSIAGSMGKNHCLNCPVNCEDQFYLSSVTRTSTNIYTFISFMSIKVVIFQPFTLMQAGLLSHDTTVFSRDHCRNPRETGNNAYAKILEGKQRVLWCFWKWPIVIYILLTSNHIIYLVLLR